MGGAEGRSNVIGSRMNRIAVLSPSSSEASTGSSDSDADAVPCAGIPDQRGPSTQLERTPAPNLRSAHRIILTKGRGDFAPPMVSSHVLPLPGLEIEGKKQKKRGRVPGQYSNAVDVVVRQANFNMDRKFKAALCSIGILCTLFFLLYFGSLLWIRMQYDLLGTNSRTSSVEPEDLPLFSGCEEMACQAYVGVVEASLNRSQDPCQDLYSFVYGGWKHHYYLSVVDAAEESPYHHALNAIRWPRIDESNGELISPGACSVEKKVVGFSRSCMYSSESSPADVKKFMADRHLPWPNSSRWDFEMTASCGGTGEPVLRISHSTGFRNWIAAMRSFAGHPVTSTSARRYRRYVKGMLGFFDVSESSAEELAPRIEEMDRLTLGTLGPAMVEYVSRGMRMAIRNLSYTATPGIAAGRLLVLFYEYFTWAHRFSATDIVEVNNPGLLQSVVYLLGVKSGTREALSLSLGLRVAHELGWMAHRGIPDVTLDLMGLTPSAHYHRCLNQVESAVGVLWTTR